MPSPLPRKASRRVIGSWAFYDFANSAFTTLIVTFIYAVYFSDVIAADHITGTAQWGRALSLSAIFIAILSPFLGAIADSGGYRKRFLVISSVVAILGSVVLFFPTSGQVTFALTTFVIANVAYEMSGVFYNAYLPDIAPLDQIGKISGYGWGLGYVGGLLCLVVGYYVLVAPDTPPFGLDTSTQEHVRATTLLVAAWFAVFSLPIFLWVHDEPVLNPPPMHRLARSAFADLMETFHHIRTYRQVVRLLVARLIYNDGLITIFGFAGLFAVAEYGVNIFIFGIVMNVSAGIGALAMGYVDDWLGGKMTIAISLAGMTLATGVAVFVSDVNVFWAMALIISLLAGPNQSASRSLFGRFIPDKHENKFYGFYAFSGKFTAFLGPFLLATLTEMFNSNRVGISVVVVLFVIGGLLLFRVDEKEGMLAAGKIPE